MGGVRVEEPLVFVLRVGLKLCSQLWVVVHNVGQREGLLASAEGDVAQAHQKMCRHRPPMLAKSTQAANTFTANFVSSGRGGQQSRSPYMDLLIFEASPIFYLSPNKCDLPCILKNTHGPPCAIGCVNKHWSRTNWVDTPGCENNRACTE